MRYHCKLKTEGMFGEAVDAHPACPLFYHLTKQASILFLPFSLLSFQSMDTIWLSISIVMHPLQLGEMVLLQKKHSIEPAPPKKKKKCTCTTRAEFN